MIEWKDSGGGDLKSQGSARVIKDCHNRDGEKIASVGDVLENIEMPGPDTAATLADDGRRYFSQTMGYNRKVGKLQVLPNSHLLSS